MLRASSPTLFSISLVALTVLASASFGCGGDDAGTRAAAPDASADTGVKVIGAGDPARVTQHGVIVDLDSKKGVPGATVSAGDQVVTTGADGSYAFTVKKGEAFTMTVTAPDYAKLVEQETVIDADFDRGKTSFVSSGTASLLLGTLDGYDASLGVLSVQLLPSGACASEAGTRVKVSPEGTAKVRYVLHGIPTSRADSAAANEFPTAVIYNVEPGVPLSVSVEAGSCTQTAFPLDRDGVRYTGGVTTEAGSVTSFARIFLQ